MHEPPYFNKSDGQVVIQTYHGYQFKLAGKTHWLRAGYDVATFMVRQRNWDYLVSPATYSTPLLERDFPSPAHILEIGYPRNDIFFSAARETRRNHTRDVLGIPTRSTAILYAPTFRDYLAVSERKAEFSDFLDLEVAARELTDDNVVILFRGHAMNARLSTRNASRDNVIDVTDYPDINDLCLASDAAILDYSSLRFDYALSNKPMIYLVPDLERYRETRGWMLAYHLTTPGPHVKTTPEVVHAVKTMHEWQEDYCQKRLRFLNRYMDLEDGYASKRLVDAVFGDTQE